MGIFKAYFDDSRDEEYPKEVASSLGGYVGTIRDWNYFQNEWKVALSNHDVPYLHMKELAHCEGPFRKYKNDEAARISLLRSLIEIIKNSHLKGFSSTVLLEDMKLFNDVNIENKKYKEHRDKINAYALNLFSCMRCISNEFPKSHVEIILDRTNYIDGKKRKALIYAEKDKLYKDYELLRFVPLSKGLTFKKVIPLQAADLLAYEVAKEATTVVELKNGTYRRKYCIAINSINYAPRRKSLEYLIRKTNIRYNLRLNRTSILLIKHGGYFNIQEDKVNIGIDNESLLKPFFNDFFKYLK